MSTTNNLPLIQELAQKYEEVLKTNPRLMYDHAAELLDTDNFEEIANFINNVTAFIVLLPKKVH